MTIISTDINARLDFLRHLYAGVDDGWLAVSGDDGSSMMTRWVSVSDIDRAADAIEKLVPTSDVFFGPATRRKALGSSKRGGIKDCVRVPALWLDVDIADPVHANGNLPKSKREAAEWISAMPIPPTVVVFTGHGFQPYWALQESLDAEDAATWLTRLHITAQRIGDARGFHLDDVSNVDRILRLPETINRKAEHVLATVEIAKWSRRYGLDDLDEKLDELPEPPVQRHDGKTVWPERDWFNEHHTCDDVLRDYGCRERSRNSNGGTTWTRPDHPDPSKGRSFDTYADGHVAVWTNAIEGLQSQTGHDAWGLHVFLNFGGDFNAANQAVVAEWGETQRGEAKAERRAADVKAEKPDALWPELDSAALTGLAGEVVALFEPHTEADPVALLLAFLIGYGNAVGLRPRMKADGAVHRANLFALVIGRTAKARKGTAWSRAASILGKLDPGWATHRIVSGLSSGEGLIAAVADEKRNKDGEIIEPAKDKNLLVIEEEFSRVLAVAHREGNTLSENLRQAWDGRDLRSMTRVEQVAKSPHISVIGHITLPELRAKLTETEQLNGFGNRFMMAVVRRSKVLPAGGDPRRAEIELLAARLTEKLVLARNTDEVKRSRAAQKRWIDLYQKMAEDDVPGMVGAAASRVEPHTLRLSLVYALVAGSATVEVEHLDAAWALWSYCRESLDYIFGEKVGDEVADRLLVALRQVGPDGLDRDAQHQVLGRHVNAARLTVAAELLVSLGLAEQRTERTAGRDRQLLVCREEQ
jgi:hypothetical protein